MFDLAFLAGLAVWKWSSEPGSQERCSGVFHRRGKAAGRCPYTHRNHLERRLFVLDPDPTHHCDRPLVF